MVAPSRLFAVVACGPCSLLPGLNVILCLVRAALALEVALKMNGAVTYEKTNDGHCRFQVLLQTWEKA